jgi:dihydrofolate reductase
MTRSAAPVPANAAPQRVEDQLTLGGGSMGSVVVSEFITLDGVFQDPGGAGELAAGGWAFQFSRGPEGDQFKFDEVMAAGALLLGRVTYEGFAKAWPAMTNPFADKMNGMPKYLVSTTATDGEWHNTAVISSDIPAAVRRLKEDIDGDILVNGSGRLTRTLMEHDLVDEYRLMVYPIVLGTGRRLFEESSASSRLRLTDATRAGDTMILVYVPIRS